MYYDPSDETDVVKPLGYARGFYWIRVEDTQTGEIEDIPIHGADVVYWWSHGFGRCDCVRWRAFNEARQSVQTDIPCANQPGNRMRLLGIWNRGGEQIHPGE